jgi:hypothetical protein
MFDAFSWVRGGSATAQHDQWNFPGTIKEYVPEKPNFRKQCAPRVCGLGWFHRWQGN